MQYAGRPVKNFVPTQVDDQVMSFLLFWGFSVDTYSWTPLELTISKAQFESRQSSLVERFAKKLACSALQVWPSLA